MLATWANLAPSRAHLPSSTNPLEHQTTNHPTQLRATIHACTNCVAAHTAHTLNPCCPGAAAAAPPAELFFAACGVLLIALGVPILIASLNVVEYRVPYAFEGPFAGKTPQQRQELLWAQPDSVTYPVTLTVDKRMEPPVGARWVLGWGGRRVGCWLGSWAGGWAGGRAGRQGAQGKRIGRAQ